MSFRKRLPRSVADESDVNVSMIGMSLAPLPALMMKMTVTSLQLNAHLNRRSQKAKDEDDDSSIATDDEIYEDCNVMSGLDTLRMSCRPGLDPSFP